MSRTAYLAAWYFAHRETQRVKNAEWYRANRDSHRARSAARYAAHHAEVRAAQRRYRGTAAGMLAKVRHRAKERVG